VVSESFARITDILFEVDGTVGSSEAFTHLRGQGLAV